MSNLNLKQCSECKKKFPVMWKAKTKAHGAMCRPCWYQYTKKELKPRKSKINPKIKVLSDKRAKQYREYRKIRDEFLKNNPVCVYPGCSSRNVELHHAKGKINNLLTEVKHFRSLCRKHHNLVGDRPSIGYKLNLNIKRTTDE